MRSDQRSSFYDVSIFWRIPGRKDTQRCYFLIVRSFDDIMRLYFQRPLSVLQGYQMQPMTLKRHIHIFRSLLLLTLLSLAHNISYESH